MLKTDEMVQLSTEQGIDVIDIILSAISGELTFGESADQLFNRAKAELCGDLKKTGALFLIPSLITGLIKLVTVESGGIRRAAHLVCRTSCVLVLSDVFIDMRIVAEHLMNLLTKCADVLTPVMIAAVSLSGAEATALCLTPMTGICVNVIQHILLNWGITIASASAVIAVTGNLSVSIKLNRLFGLCRRIVKIGAGGILAVFTAVLSMQGRLGSARDGAAFRTARVAVENMIPAVGGNISDSLDSLLSAVNLVRNSLGLGFCIFIVMVCVIPILRLLAMTLMLQFFSAVSEPLGDDSMTRMLEQTGGSIEMLLIVTASAVALCGLLIGSCMIAASNMIH